MKRVRTVAHAYNHYTPLVCPGAGANVKYSGSDANSRLQTKVCPPRVYPCIENLRWWCCIQFFRTEVMSSLELQSVVGGSFDFSSFFFLKVNFRFVLWAKSSFSFGKIAAEEQVCSWRGRFELKNEGIESKDLRSKELLCREIWYIHLNLHFQPSSCMQTCSNLIQTTPYINQFIIYYVKRMLLFKTNDAAIVYVPEPTTFSPNTIYTQPCIYKHVQTLTNLYRSLSSKIPSIPILENLQRFSRREVWRNIYHPLF